MKLTHDSQSATATISDIQVLRAAAILMTLFHHRDGLLFWSSKNYENILTFWGGVDLFFVISGFVIALGLLRRWRASTTKPELAVELTAFWIKRIWRIWPTALFWIGVVMCLSWMWGGFLPGIPVFVAAAAGAANILGYTNGALCGHWPLAHYWSLSLEEQFYLILPLILASFFSHRKWLVPALSVAVVAQLFLPRAVWSLGYAIRSDALLLGVLIALAAEKPMTRLVLEPVFLRGRSWLAVLLTLSLLFLNTAFAAGQVVPFFVGAVALISAILVFFASFDEDYIFPKGRLKNLLVWIGSRSYAIYIVHMPAYFLTRELWRWIEPATVVFDGHFTLRFVLTAVVLVFGLAELNYRLLETPLRRRGAAIAEAYRQSRRAALPALAPVSTTAA